MDPFTQGHRSHLIHTCQIQTSCAGVEAMTTQAVQSPSVYLTHSYAPSLLISTRTQRQS